MGFILVDFSACCQLALDPALMLTEAYSFVCPFGPFRRYFGASHCPCLTL